jgi:hypothetical protein
MTAPLRVVVADDERPARALIAALRTIAGIHRRRSGERRRSHSLIERYRPDVRARRADARSRRLSVVRLLRRRLLQICHGLREHAVKAPNERGIT